VFQLRLQISQDPRSEATETTVTLIDQLFRNLIYAVLVGLVFTTLAIAADATRDEARLVKIEGIAVLKDQDIAVIWSAALIALGVHMLTILAMCLKRLGSAYSKLTIS